MLSTLGCSMSLIKLILFAFNSIFVILGLVLVAFGVLGLTGHVATGLAAVAEAASGGEIDISKLVSSSSISTLSKAILVIGIIVFFVAFLGCCGAISENNVKVMLVSIVQTKQNFFYLILHCLAVAVSISFHLFPTLCATLHMPESIPM